MKVVVPEDSVERFLQFSSCPISFSCNNKDLAMQLLNGISDLQLSSEPYYNSSDKTLKITPYRLTRSLIFNNLPNTFTDIADIKQEPTKVSVVDFDGSAELYEKVGKRGSPIKIIEDEFSILRGRVLFEYISKIELNLRSGLHKGVRSRSIGKPLHYRTNSPDDIVSQYDLTEMMNEHLLAPSSDEYYISQLNAAGDDRDDIIAARKSLVLDELELPFGSDEYKSFVKVRNSIMHFRVVTYADSESIIKFYEKMAHYDIIQLVRGIANSSKANQDDI